MPDYDKRYIPPKVHRREITAKVHRRRTCDDQKPYFPVTWTIPSPAEADFGPRWVADRDYWIGGAAAAMDSDAAGADVELNIRRITTGGSDGAVFASDARLVIPVGEQVDEISGGAGDPWDVPDVNIERLFKGERVYPRILQFGTGDRLEVTLQLVPVRQVVV